MFNHLKRREFITLLGGAVAWPVAARAQQAERMRRVGVLMGRGESDTEGQARIAAFREQFQRLGWIEGRNVQIEIRWQTPEADSLQRLAKELVTLKPDVLLSESTPPTAALLQQTRTIPIVFAVVSDPIGSGFVASLARPGGNATGFLNIEGSLGGKWMELLKEIAPRIARVAFLYNPTAAPYAEIYLKPFKAAAASLAVEGVPAPVRDISGLETEMGALARAPSGGLIVMPDAFMNTHRAKIVSLAAFHRIPAVYAYRQNAQIGGLLSYGFDTHNNFRLAATYIDRILKGEKAGELPVQAQDKFELVINLGTAKALGLEVPPTLLARADEVIE
jgi:putative ABC transport system substrate-binding protein